MIAGRKFPRTKRPTLRAARTALRALCAALFLGTFCASPGVYAQDLLTLYRLGQKNDPEIQRARYEHMAKKEAMKQAIAGYLPVLTAQGEYVDTSQDIVSSDNTVFASGKTDFKTKTYTLTLTQPLVNYASFMQISQAGAKVSQANMTFEAAKQDLMIRVAERYLAALASKDNLGFVRAEETADRGHYELAKARHAMGLAPITDLHDAKARMTEVSARVFEAETVLDDAREALREVCGEHVGDLASLRQEVPLKDPSPDDMNLWIKGALDRNPEVLAQRFAVEAARREVSRQNAGHWPTVDLVGRHNNRDTDGSLFGGGSEVETTEILVQANFTLFQGGYVLSRAREAKNLLRAAQRELERLERSVKRRVRAAFLGVKSAISRVKALEESVRAQELTLDAKKYGFKSGLYTSLAVLDAERDLYLAKQKLSQARYDYLLNSLRLKRAAGILKEEDLEVINAWFQ